MCKLKSHDELVTLSLTGEPDLEASKIGWVAVNDNLSSSVLKLPNGEIYHTIYYVMDHGIDLSSDRTCRDVDFQFIRAVS